MNRPEGPGAMVCPGCGRLIARDAPVCPYCERRVAAAPAFGSLTGRLFGERLSYTRVFLVANVALYLLTLIVTFRSRGLSGGAGGGTLSILPIDLNVMFKAGAHMRGPVLEGQWWRLVMSTFLHFDLVHLACNMWGLLWLGPIVEQVFGKARFVIIYLGAGVAGSVVWQVFSGGLGISAGASGSIFGLVTAVAVFGYRHGGIFGRALMQRMLIWSALMFAFGFSVSSINNWAHGGGAVAGAALAATLGLSHQGLRREGRRVQMIAAAGLAVCGISFVWTVVAAMTGPDMQEARSKSVFMWHEDEVCRETEEMLAWAEKSLAIVGSRRGVIESDRERRDFVDSLGEVAQVLEYWALAGRRADPAVDPADLARGLRELQQLARDRDASRIGDLAARLLPEIRRMRRALPSGANTGEPAG